MAELHGRIRGIPNRFLTALGLVVALLAGAPTARAQDGSPESAGTTALEDTGAAQAALSTTEDELARWAEGLESEDGATREASIAALLALEEEALPAIRARVERFSRRPLDTDESYRALNSFRHVTGSRRADDDVDIVPGIPVVLEEDRSEVTVAMAERMLLVRALSDMGSREAGPVLGDILATDTQAWRWEAKRVVWHMRARIVPILIEGQRHDDAGVRRWARWGLRELEMTDPGRVVQQEDMSVLADVLRAYATVMDFDAMPIVVSFVTHDRGEVRNAARWAVDQYGRNAIWQLRRVYENLTGEDADSEWGWRETADALYAAYDERRLAPVREALEAGLAAQAAEDWDAMQAHFDDVLLRAPLLASRARMAPGYARLAERAVAAGDLEEAARLYRRALRLAPNDASSARWRAEVRFVEAEQRLAAGVADLEAYREVLELAPGHPGATRFVAAVEGDDEGLAATLSAVPTRRYAAGLAGLALAVAAFFLWRSRKEDAQENTEDELDIDDAPDTIDSAPDTLPG